MRRTILVACVLACAAALAGCTPAPYRYRLEAADPAAGVDVTLRVFLVGRDTVWLRGWTGGDPLAFAGLSAVDHARVRVQLEVSRDSSVRDAGGAPTTLVRVPVRIPFSSATLRWRTPAGGAGGSLALRGLLLAPAVEPAEPIEVRSALPPGWHLDSRGRRRGALTRFEGREARARLLDATLTRAPR